MAYGTSGDCIEQSAARWSAAYSTVVRLCPRQLFFFFFRPSLQFRHFASAEKSMKQWDPNLRFLNSRSFLTTAPTMDCATETAPLRTKAAKVFGFAVQTTWVHLLWRYRAMDNFQKRNLLKAMQTWKIPFCLRSLPITAARRKYRTKQNVICLSVTEP